MKIVREPFGKTKRGKPVSLYTLGSESGLKVRIAEYGATIVSIEAPDRRGEMADIVLGFDKLDGYLGQHPYFGAIIGRYANRIAGGKFTLNNTNYNLSQNRPNIHLHGGDNGFDKVVWCAADANDSIEHSELALTYESADGEEGYPGTLSAQVVYSVDDNNALTINYRATTDKDTIINLTNHSYFNLAGHGDITGHEVTLNADEITPVDKFLVPTGELRPVTETPFDFRCAHAIGTRINCEEEQLEISGGYDHNWVLNRTENNASLAAVVVEPLSGRRMQVHTTQPGVQFYTGNFLDGSITGKGGTVYGRRSGFCLETQHFADSPNQPCFPTTILRAGEVFSEKTIFKFSVATD